MRNKCWVCVCYECNMDIKRSYASGLNISMEYD